MKVLVVNAGSSSLKYQLFDTSSGDVLDGNIYKNDIIEILNNYRPN